MQRRDVLCGVGSLCAALVAGCLDAPDSSPAADGSPTSDVEATAGDSPTDDDTPATDTTPTTSYPAPTADDLAARATALRASATDSPPRIDVSLSNAADHDVRVMGGATLPFTRYGSEDGALTLIPDDREHVGSRDDDADGLVPDSRTDGCWQAESGLVIDSIGIESVLGSEESTSSAFTVLAADGCPPAGTHTFRNPIAASDGRGRGDTRTLTIELELERSADGDVADCSASVVGQQ